MQKLYCTYTYTHMHSIQMHVLYPYAVCVLVSSFIGTLGEEERASCPEGPGSVPQSVTPPDSPPECRVGESWGGAVGGAQEEWMMTGECMIGGRIYILLKLYYYVTFVVRTSLKLKHCTHGNQRNTCKVDQVEQLHSHGW